MDQWGDGLLFGHCVISRVLGGIWEAGFEVRNLAAAATSASQCVILLHALTACTFLDFALRGHRSPRLPGCVTGPHAAATCVRVRVTACTQLCDACSVQHINACGWARQFPGCCGPWLLGRGNEGPTACKTNNDSLPRERNAFVLCFP